MFIRSDHNRLLFTKLRLLKENTDCDSALLSAKLVCFEQCKKAKETKLLLHASILSWLTTVYTEEVGCVLTSLFSLFYIAGECYRVWHWGWAKNFVVMKLWPQTDKDQTWVYLQTCPLHRTVYTNWTDFLLMKLRLESKLKYFYSPGTSSNVQWHQLEQLAL